MAYIHLNNNLPGIRGLLIDHPATGVPLLQLADALLQHTSELSKGERELIATYVSSQNDCQFCQLSHGAAAAHHLNATLGEIDSLKKDMQHSPLVSDKLKSLLHIAGKVQQSGKAVTQQDIDAAKDLGATDNEIHDTVLIAAAFCMFNRYVDGLHTHSPADPEVYRDASKRMAEQGYMRKELLDLMSKQEA